MASRPAANPVPRCMRRYAVYLFDLDGTLIDTAPDIQQAANAALAQGGFESIDIALTRRFVGRGGRLLLHSALENQGIAAIESEELDHLYGYFLSHYDAHIAELSRPYQGVEETLGELRAAGSRLGVITNKLEGLSQKLLAALDMRDYFDLLLGIDTLIEHKPHPLPILHACRMLGSELPETLFVGDSATDVAAARAAGCDVVCVDYGYSGEFSPVELGADCVIASFRELP